MRCYWQLQPWMLFMIGMPEARIILISMCHLSGNFSQSNASYMAIGKAAELVKQSGSLPVRSICANAPTKLMQELNYGSGYRVCPRL